MIASLISPTICLIDDEEIDFRPILEALNGLHLGCVHLKGSNEAELPSAGKQFKSLRLVFTDLHLSGTYGKAAASHTANVFSRIVSEETGPVLVVIWSKYAGDVVKADLPSGEEETEAALFKRTLLEAFPNYKEKLIFLEMAKPKPPRAQEWVDELKAQINATLIGQDAVHAVWIWESLVKEAAALVSAGLTTMSVTANDVSLAQNLTLTLQLLTHAQCEGVPSADAAPRYFASALSQLLLDQLEHLQSVQSLTQHGPWLANKAAGTDLAERRGKINAGLLTTAAQNTATPLLPGTVYRISNHEFFQQSFGFDVLDLMTELYNGSANGWQDWLKKAAPVLIELSPACDIDNGKRRSALFIAGLVLPAATRSSIKAQGDGVHVFPDFELRWTLGDYQPQSSILAVLCRYRVTAPPTQIPPSLLPWFRLRELPTASLRNLNAGQVSRVGYVSC